MAGFYEKIRDWALESQKDKWSQALIDDVPDPTKPLMDPDYLRDFVYMGGEYQDTNSRSMFKSFFADYGGADFEHASGGRYGDDEEGEREFVQGQNIDYFVDQIDDYVREMERSAENAAYNLDEDEFLSSFSFEVVDPQNFEEWTQEATYNLAKLKLDASDYKKSKELNDKLTLFCNKFCDQSEKLKNEIENLSKK